MDHDSGDPGPLALLEGGPGPRPDNDLSTGWRRSLTWGRARRPAGTAEAVTQWAAGDRSAATAAHYATLAGAFAFWLWLGRGLWYYGDEWDFLVRRGLSFAPSNHRSIWFPHNEHWSTLPILLWRGIYSVFHLSSYWPYLVPVLLAHIALMHLVWRLCRRAGVHPWVATAAVALLGFLGAGSGDLLSGFQIGFVGAVMFGLIAFDLIDRARGRRQSDALVPLALLASLMCSTVGDAMVVGAAVLLLARRTPKQVVAVLALPLASYAVWFAALGRPSISAPRDTFSLSSFTTLPGYIWYGLSSGLGQAFNMEDAGSALLVGLAAWVVWRMRSLWRDCPSLLGLCTAALTFYALTGLGRDLTAGASTTIVSRYLYVGVALLVPVMAKLLSSASSWPAARLAVIALLALTILGDVGQAQSAASTTVTAENSQKVQLVATARLLVAGAPYVSGPSGSPVGLFPSLSAASIERLERAGLLPRTPPTAVEYANARAALAVGTWNGYRTQLLLKPLFKGRFAFVAAVHGAVSWRADGCLDISPETISPAMQVWLHPPRSGKGASVSVSAAPAAPGLTNYLPTLLVPPSGPASVSPVEIEMPNSGAGYLSDDDLDGDLVLLWDVGSPLTLCGLAGAHRG